MTGLSSLSRRLWRNKALLLLALALTVAVTALTSVSFFVDRVNRALLLQGATLMAADLVVQQGDATPGEWARQAALAGLKTSRQVVFPSVVFHQDRPVLVQVKAVDENYPLRGEFRVRIGRELLQSAPARGQAYASASLRRKLGIDDQGLQLPLGKLQLLVRGEVIQEPDLSGNLFQFAPQLMMNYADVAATGLLTPASRAQYRFLVAGPAHAVEEMRRWLASRLPPGAKIMGVENARPEMRQALDRGQRFLELAALCASLLSGIAIMLAARQYVTQAMDGVAVMRTLGMSAAQVLGYHLKEVLLVFLLGSLLGIFAGYLGQQMLYALIGDWFGGQLPAPGWRSVGLAFAYALVLLCGFSLPALWRIRHIAPLRVLRRDLEPVDVSAWLSWGVAAGIFAILVIWQVQDWRLAAAMLALVAVIILLVTAFGWMLILFLRRFRGRAGGVGIGIAALTRNPGLTLWQLLGFTMGITMLLLLALVRVDLLEMWQGSLPRQAPNHFLINIQPGEQLSLQRWFDEQGIKHSGMYATARGRLIRLDGRALNADQYTDDRARHLLMRAFSLGFSDRLQSDNKTVAGVDWVFSPEQAGGFSVEVGLAKTLGIRLGSRLDFDVAGQTLSAEVINLRSVAWDSFNVNFFIQGNAALMADLPVAYISSLYLDENNTPRVVRKLEADHPSVSLLDIRPMLARVRQVMDQGAKAVESVFLFTLLAAVLVTLSAVQISREERAAGIAILRTLGGSRRLVTLAMLTEFGLLGLFSGFLGATLAAVTEQLIAGLLFDLDAGWNAMLWLTGMAGGLLGLVLIGFLVTRSLLRTPPVQVLRSG
ncbi:ABC transporter permease [Thiolapillus sp.]